VTAEGSLKTNPSLGTNHRKFTRENRNISGSFEEDPCTVMPCELMPASKALSLGFDA
jgi:hypothetical protein